MIGCGSSVTARRIRSARALGISQMQVSRLLRDTLAKMRLNLAAPELR